MRCILRQERNEYAKRVRKIYEGGGIKGKEKRYEKDGRKERWHTNTITSVTKDNMLYEEDDTDMCDKREE